MLGVQLLGYAFDALWHGVLNPGFEPTTIGEMARHLATVHLSLYAGAFGVLVTTALALLEPRRRSGSGIALPIALGGAVLSAAAEAWHALSHLRMDTHSGPIAGSLSFVGFLVVVVAMWRSSPRRGRRAGDAAKDRRAA